MTSWGRRDAIMPSDKYEHTNGLWIVGLILSAVLSYAIMVGEDAPAQPTAVAHQITIR
jgi:hypothetical protein